MFLRTMKMTTKCGLLSYPIWKGKSRSSNKRIPYCPLNHMTASSIPDVINMINAVQTLGEGRALSLTMQQHLRDSECRQLKKVKTWCYQGEGRALGENEENKRRSWRLPRW